MVHANIIIIVALSVCMICSFEDAWNSNPLLDLFCNHITENQKVSIALNTLICF